jgi:hypothetical protein
MAKRRTGKRSVKRAFKKRRTIRKFRKTMRRYIQSGGDPMMMKLLLIVFALIAASNPKLAALLELFSGDQGSNNKAQIGGGFAKDKVINGLNTLQRLYGDDMTLPEDTRNRIKAMIPRLTEKIGKVTENPQVVVQPLDLNEIDKEVSQNNETVSPSDDNTKLLVKLKNAFLSKVDLYKTKLNTLLEGKIQSIKQKYGLDDKDVEDIKFLKSVVIDDVLGKKDKLFDDIKGNPKVIAEMATAAAAAAKEKAAALAAAAKEKATQMFSSFGRRW